MRVVVCYHLRLEIWPLSPQLSYLWSRASLKQHHFFKSFDEICQNMEYVNYLFDDNQQSRYHQKDIDQENVLLNVDLKKRKRYSRDQVRQPVYYYRDGHTRASRVLPKHLGCVQVRYRA
jgi:hypothetical protein